MSLISLPFFFLSQKGQGKQTSDSQRPFCLLLCLMLLCVPPSSPAWLAPYLTMALVKTDTVYVPGVLESRTMKAPSLPWNGEKEWKVKGPTKPGSRNQLHLSVKEIL